MPLAYMVRAFNKTLSFVNIDFVEENIKLKEENKKLKDIIKNSGEEAIKNLAFVECLGKEEIK
jgi:hypothetical protein